MGQEVAQNIGRVATLSFAEADPSADPSSATLLTIGTLTTKALELNGNSVSVFTDQSGEIDKFIIANKTVTISGEGLTLAVDGDQSNYIALYLYFANSTAENQPIIWVEYVRPDVTCRGFFIVESMSETDPSTEVSTFSISLAAAPSSFQPDPAFTKTPSA